VPFDRRESPRIQIESENDEQTPGGVWEEGIRESITNNRFI
jgi:hypothetical protein